MSKPRASRAKDSLSKSLFIRGLQCHKSLYLHKHCPELKDEMSQELQLIFNAGHEVGKKAQEIFPGGVEIPFEEGNYAGQVEKTKAAIDKGARVLYEATFSHNNVFVKADILRKGKKGWELYEVKSATSVEDVHIKDTALQYHVIQDAGLAVTKASVVHINNQYSRDGDIDVKELFTLVDKTSDVKALQLYVRKEVQKLQKMLAGAEPTMEIGKQCAVPYLCDFHGYCWKHIPSESVFDLKQKGVDKFDLYRRGIIKMKDIPLDILNKHQKTQVEALLGKKVVVNRSALRSFLGKLWHPICFLDFETVSTAIPLFDGVRPYQQIPFQYSLHVREKEKGRLSHSEYIALPGTDPRKELLTKLLKEIPDNACVITYTGFEKQRLLDLATWFPRHQKKIDRIIDNIRDLSQPFKQKDYYHWRMNGSYSIKKVLPNLVPDMGYDSMEINNGQMAVDAYLKMSSSSDEKEITSIRKNLSDYCSLDTLAMVRILEQLERVQ